MEAPGNADLLTDWGDDPVLNGAPLPL